MKYNWYAMLERIPVPQAILILQGEKTAERTIFMS